MARKSKTEEKKAEVQAEALVPPAPTTLQMVDRSRLIQGWGKCKRAMYLEYYAPPTGYGIRKRKESIPLATGSSIHEGLAELITHRFTTPASERMGAYEEIIKGVVERYQKLVEKKGFLEQEEGKEETLRIMNEQSALIAGMLWGFVRVGLEPLFEEYDIIAVEQEEQYVVKCSCGLGDGVGVKEEHEARGCLGFLIMTKPDLLLMRKVDRKVFYVEFKSLGQDSMKWRKKFDENVQLALGAVGAEARLGVPIEFAKVIGLVKGWRFATKDPITGEKGKGPRMQDSVFCYAYRRAPNPPFDPGEWQFHYDYVDEGGQNRKATESKGFQKVKVWEHLGMREWVEAMPIEELQKGIVELGPLGTPRNLIPKMLRAIAGEMERLVQGLWETHEVGEQEGWDPQSEKLQRVLDFHFPQSWQCVNEYGYVCQFEDICKLRTGWEDPIGSGKYEIRRPHHSPELLQIQARGIELPEGQEEEGEEEGS